MNDIQKILDETSDHNSTNQLALANVKSWLTEYLQLRVQEIQRFPEESLKNHWDMIAADYESTQHAHFLVAYFSGSEVTFLAGRGPIQEVHSFAQFEFPRNPDEVLDIIKSKFTVSNRCTMKFNDIVTWIKSC